MTFYCGGRGGSQVITFRFFCFFVSVGTFSLISHCPSAIMDNTNNTFGGRSPIFLLLFSILKRTLTSGCLQHLWSLFCWFTWPSLWLSEGNGGCCVDRGSVSVCILMRLTLNISWEGIEKTDLRSTRQTLCFFGGSECGSCDPMEDQNGEKSCKLQQMNKIIGTTMHRTSISKGPGKKKIREFSF